MRNLTVLDALNANEVLARTAKGPNKAILMTCLSVG